MDGRTNGRTDEWTDGPMDGWTDQRTDGRTNGWTDGPMDGRTDRPSYRGASEHLKIVKETPYCCCTCTKFSSICWVIFIFSCFFFFNFKENLFINYPISIVSLVDQLKRHFCNKSKSAVHLLTEGGFHFFKGWSHDRNFSKPIFSLFFSWDRLNDRKCPWLSWIGSKRGFTAQYLTLIYKRGLNNFIKDHFWISAKRIIIDSQEKM